MGSAYDTLFSRVNRTDALNARPFDPATSVATPHGRWGVVHYGVMVPGLPPPFRFFDAIVVLGTSRAPIFDNRKLVETTPADSAWILTGSAADTDSFRCHSIAAECDLAADGSRLRFGDYMTMDRSTERVAVCVTRPGVTVELDLRPTQVVSHFAHLRGLYDHWSVLCEYAGTFRARGLAFESRGLCTYEYARAVNLPLPFRFFTYQILNIDDDTQVLMTEVLGPRRLPVQRTVYVRSLDGSGTTHTRGYRHVVHEYAAEPRFTPDGVAMRMPRRFSWTVAADDGQELVRIDGNTNDDFSYGVAAGYAGSYEYTGSFHGRPVSGTGYIEWIDR